MVETPEQAQKREKISIAESYFKSKEFKIDILSIVPIIPVYESY